MKTIKNRFGAGILNDMVDLEGKSYVLCTACLSIYTDFLSWAQLNKDRLTLNIEEAENIIVLGCQVTDLAILNDLKYAEGLSKHNDNIYIGGCLSQRFDIDLPYKRLDVIRIENQEITDFKLIDYAKPFWVKDFIDSDNEFKEGNLFRNSYPLKIGAGCQGKCKYCTIRDTRGQFYESNAYDQIEEFLNNEDVVLISDSPTVKQINDWCDIAYKYNKQISIRNVEPQIALVCAYNLNRLAEAGLLKVLHCPIQSDNFNLLCAMNRNPQSTFDYIHLSGQLRDKGVKIATNIIIDYTDEKGNFYHNMNEDFLNKNFDYWVWNPYFDGKWNRNKAEERWGKYIG